MGLFDFVRNIGKKIFHKEEDAAAKIKAEIEASNPGISGLQVNYNPADGKVSLSGNAVSEEAMEKSVLIAGNIEGVSVVDAEGVTYPRPPEPEPTAAAAAPAPKVEYYIIQKGDNLSKIAKHFYGNANKYPKIFEANREVIKDPDLIFPGQKIRIPLDE
jgi:nucleoid-associated protein YgaU